MKPISLQQAAKMAGGLLLAGAPDQLVHSVHFDSRLIDEKGLFIAVKGQTRDGHDYIRQAAEKGASAALVSDEARIPAALPPDFGLILVNDTLRGFQKLAAAYRTMTHIPCIAVTGSNGKTTAKDIISHVLSQKLAVCRTYKNLNNHLGVPYSLLQIEPTDQAAVLELGMNHAGEIDLLASLVKPQISVITYIGDAHLEYFGTRDKIALAKAELLPHTDRNGLVLLNGDNPYLRKVAHLYEGKTLYYSVEAPADIWAERISAHDDGTRFVVRFREGDSAEVNLPLHGKHNVANALPAIAIARRFGMTLPEIAEALRTVSISAMRFQVLTSASGGLFINDAYNASPASMKAAIETFAEIYPDRKKVLVLGDMFELGQDSDKLHASVGAFANRYRDRFHLLVTVGEASRFLHDAYHGEKRHFPDKTAAKAALAPYRSSEYALLFKASRGMKLETLLEEVKG